MLTPDEVRLLDNRYALLFIRGERPVMDLKYDILKHPNVSLTADGKSPPYEHGFQDYAIGTLVFENMDENTALEDIDIDAGDYVIYSSEEIETYPNKLSEVNEHE